MAWHVVNGVQLVQHQHEHLHIQQQYTACKQLGSSVARQNQTTRGRSQVIVHLSFVLVDVHHAQNGSRAGLGGTGHCRVGQQCGPSKGMCVHPECEPLQDLKSAVAALVLDGMLRLARRDGEVLGIVDHAR